MPFNPSPQVAAQIFQRFFSASHSLFEIAAEFGTDIVSFCDWANRPEVRRELEAIEAELRAQAQAAAQAALPLALATLAKLDAEYPHLAPRKRPKVRRAKPVVQKDIVTPAPPGAVPPPLSAVPMHIVTRHKIFFFRKVQPRPTALVPN